METGIVTGLFFCFRLHQYGFYQVTSDDVFEAVFIVTSRCGSAHLGVDVLSVCEVFLCLLGMCK